MYLSVASANNTTNVDVNQLVSFKQPVPEGLKGSKKKNWLAKQRGKQVVRDRINTGVVAQTEITRLKAKERRITKLINPEFKTGIHTAKTAFQRELNKHQRASKQAHHSKDTLRLPNSDRVELRKHLDQADKLAERALRYRLTVENRNNYEGSSQIKDYNNKDIVNYRNKHLKF